MDETGFNSTEFVVTQKKEGKNLTLRRILMFSYIAFFLAFTITFMALKLIPVIAILPLLLWIAVHFTWRYTNLEHKYVIERGEITFYDVYSSDIEKQRLKIKISDMKLIAFVKGEFSDEIKKATAKNTYDFRGSVKSENSLFALFDENGNCAIVFFEYCKKAESLFNLYNKNCSKLNKDLSINA
ncbi:MAG: hypothetical protein RR057_01710 [Clostridia bacterium]